MTERFFSPLSAVSHGPSTRHPGVSRIGAVHVTLCSASGRGKGYAATHEGATAAIAPKIQALRCNRGLSFEGPGFTGG